jgi:hypothetical protein
MQRGKTGIRKRGREEGKTISSCCSLTLSGLFVIGITCRNAGSIKTGFVLSVSFTAAYYILGLSTATGKKDARETSMNVLMKCLSHLS